MKVLLINGSPHEKGCTYTALSLIAGELNAVSYTHLDVYKRQVQPVSWGLPLMSRTFMINTLLLYARKSGVLV